MGRAAVGLAAAWLLPHRYWSEVTVAPLYCERNACGYDPVVLDLGAAHDLGDERVMLPAHEFHHLFRNDLLYFDRSGMDGILSSFCAGETAVPDPG